MLSTMGSHSDMSWPLKDKYTKIMFTGLVKQWNYKQEYFVVFQLVVITKYDDYWNCMFDFK